MLFGEQRTSFATGIEGLVDRGIRTNMSASLEDRSTVRGLVAELDAELRKARPEDRERVRERFYTPDGQYETPLTVLGMTEVPWGGQTLTIALTQLPGAPEEIAMHFPTVISQTGRRFAVNIHIVSGTGKSHMNFKEVDSKDNPIGSTRPGYSNEIHLNSARSEGAILLILILKYILDKKQ